MTDQPPQSDMESPLLKRNTIGYDDDSSIITLPSLQSDTQTILNTVRKFFYIILFGIIECVIHYQINLYVGVGLLSTGYAVKLGGWASLLVLGLCTFMFSSTAVLLCWAAEALPPHVIPSYPNIATFAIGKSGQWIVTTAVLLEFWGALGMCLIVLWHSIILLLPALREDHICLISTTLCLSLRNVAALGSALIVVPAVLIRSFSRLTSISISGVTGSILLCSVVALAFCLDPSSSQVEDPKAHSHHILSLQSLPVSAGIFLVSLSGHAGLPSLRRSMKNPENFARCLRITFSCMFFLYGAMGALSYLYFGDSLQVLVTASLTQSSSVSSILIFHWGPLSLSISSALSILVALSVYSTIPTLVYVMAEMVLDLLTGDTANGHQANGFLEAILRLIVLGFGYATALIGYDVLAYVESLVGGVCSILVSLILPALIFHCLFKHKISFLQLLLIKFLIGIGVVAMIGIFSKNVMELWALNH